MAGTDMPAHQLAGGVMLDGLFRASASARPNAFAVADPINRALFTDGVAMRLSYGEMDSRIERLAQTLASFGIPAGSVVAVQLPNIVELPIAILAILRAGFVAAPVPMLWRRSELVASLGSVAPRAMITLARLNDDRPAETLCEAAAELFELSFPCAFGSAVPDGVVPLDRGDGHAAAAATLPQAGGGVSLLTFDTDAEGFFAAGRTDAQWLAAGLGTLLEANMQAGDTIVTTLPFHSLAGLSAAFVPWLLCGGTLQLIHGHAPEAIGATGATARVHLVAPATALGEVTKARKVSCLTGVAVHRGAGTAQLDFSGARCERVVDLHCFGEVGAVALSREDAKHAQPIPQGPVSALSGAAGAPVVIEVKLGGGQVWLRGPMVTREPYPAGLGAFRTARDDQGFIRTGFRARSDGNGGLVVDAGPDRVISVGGLRFGLDDLRLRFSACTDDVKLSAIEDPLLGERLHIEAADREAVAAALHAAGHSQIVVDAAVRPSASRAAR